MPFDNAKWNKPAAGGDVAGVALDVSIALQSLNTALAKLSKSSGADIKSEMASIEKAREDLWTSFVELTGYTPS